LGRQAELILAGLLGSSVVLFLCPAILIAAPESPSNPPAQVNGQTNNSANKAGNNSSVPDQSQAQPEPHFFVKEYQVEGGGHLLPNVEVEAAVYPYLGPYRTTGDVEQARGALEQAYRDKGYQTVTVQIPPQKLGSGVVILQVMRGEVARLRVHGSRYFSIDQIKREAPSLQEGQSPNFSQVTHDLLVLNELPDRQVTPTVRPGETPGSVDVDLNVKDKLPLHGSLEINNRYSTGTTQLRLNGSVSYDNLWQLGHSIGFSFQVSPEDPGQVKVFSGYYLARIPDMSWLSLMLQGTKQNSDVNTLGGIGVAGNGETVGLRAIISLPPLTDFYQSLSLGFDYKHFTQDVQISGTDTLTPVTYYPFSAAYSGNWIGKGYETDLNASVNLATSQLGSSNATFDLNRHGASGDFMYFRGDLSHTHDLPGGFQLFAKAQGQAADQPLVNSEQFSGGGLGTVRGLLESEVLGDNGILGTVELRTPSLSEFLGKTVDEWRFYVFNDGGMLTNDEPLVESPYQYNLDSVGAGTRIKVAGHLNGSLDVGIPLVIDTLESNVPANAYIQNPISEHPYEARLTFRVWADF